MIQAVLNSGAHVDGPTPRQTGMKEATAEDYLAEEDHGHETAAPQGRPTGQNLQSCQVPSTVVGGLSR